MTRLLRYLLSLFFLVTLPLSADAAYTLISWSWSQGGGSATDGFKVKCGRSSGSYIVNITVSDPAARNLSVYSATAGKGKWYCTVSAFNASGESSNGNEIQFVLPAPPILIMPNP